MANELERLAEQWKNEADATLRDETALGTDVARAMLQRDLANELRAALQQAQQADRLDHNAALKLKIEQLEYECRCRSYVQVCLEAQDKLDKLNGKGCGLLSVWKRWTGW